jgi:hypothetical protein
MRYRAGCKITHRFTHRFTHCRLADNSANKGPSESVTSVTSVTGFVHCTLFQGFEGLLLWMPLDRWLLFLLKFIAKLDVAALMVDEERASELCHRFYA